MDQIQSDHVYHHYDNDGARINVSFEQNSRGVNFSATVTGTKTVAEAILLLLDAKKALEQQFVVISVSETVTKKEK